jgi:hypothetical protein
MLTVILGVGAAAFFLLYLARRRARLRSED